MVIYQKLVVQVHKQAIQQKQELNLYKKELDEIDEINEVDKIDELDKLDKIIEIGK